MRGSKQTWNKYGQDADVWSLGMIFLEILTGKRIQQMRKEGLINQKPPGLIEGFPSAKILSLIPNSQKNLVMGMLDKDQTLCGKI